MATTIEAPSRSYEQRMRALERANDVRSKRAELKWDLRTRRRSVVDVLSEPPEYVETMKLWDLLLAVPKWGRVKVAKTLKVVGVSPSRTVGGLSSRQRSELVALMRRRG